MNLSSGKKILVLTLLVAGGILLLGLSGANAQQCYICNCVSGQSSPQYTSYAPYASPSQHCQYYCAAYLGVQSVGTCTVDCTITGCTNPAESCQPGPLGTMVCLPSTAPDCTITGCTNPAESCQAGPLGSMVCLPISTGPDCTITGCTNPAESCQPGPLGTMVCLPTGINPGGTGGLGTGGTTGGTGTGGVGPPMGSATLPNFIGYTSISALIAAIANFLITYIVMPFAVIMIIYSGLLFVTAGGNEEKIKKAKRNLSWTLLGVVIILSANVLITYIQSLLSGQGGGQVQTFLNSLKAPLNQLILVVFALATVYFIWGIVMFMRATGSGDEQGITTGKRHMVWGIIGMAIMGAAAGIINLIQSIIP